MKFLPPALVFLFFLLIANLFGSSCANIIPPAGGPRDSLPPTLLTSVPADSTLNFRGDQVEFTFDEYIDLQDVPNNVLFTPLFENNPEISVRNKTVTVKFKDSLAANTTYILNFGSAIRDYNEGNILKDFVYTFSTGAALDTGTISGKVILAQTATVDTTLIVVLHRSLNDSAVRLQRPQYVTRLDREGNFTFRNLPRGEFAVYAMSDVGNSRRYQQASQLFAFGDSTVSAGDAAVTLYAYRETPTPSLTLGTNPLTRSPPNAAANRLTFTTNLSNDIQDIQKDLVINFPAPISGFDSARMQLSTDSIFQGQGFTARFDSARKALTIKTAWKSGTRYNLVLDRDFASDSAGKRLLKTDTLFFTTKKLSDYANVSVRLKNIDLARNPVLFMMQNEQVMYSGPVPAGTFRQNGIVPGEYELRILYDTNKNGKWDPGQFFGTRRQPELIVPLAQKITVKADWDNDFER